MVVPYVCCRHCCELYSHPWHSKERGKHDLEANFCQKAKDRILAPELDEQVLGV